MLGSQEAAASQHPHAARQQAQHQGAGKGGKGGQSPAGSGGPQHRDARATTAETEALRKADRVGRELKAKQEQGEPTQSAWATCAVVGLGRSQVRTLAVSLSL